MDRVSDSKVEAVLDLARQLWAERDGTDVDLIDGAFYWRICRGELTKRLTQLLSEGEELGDAPLVSPEKQRHLRETFDHLQAISMEIPGFSRWIEHEEPARMRDALDLTPNLRLPVTRPIMMRSPTTVMDVHMQAANVVSIGIRNSRWLGKDVEATLREVVAVRPIPCSDEMTLPSDTFDRMGITFDFFDSGELTLETDWMDLRSGEDRYVRVASPVIVCTSTFPLPPPGLIAATYDLIARQQHQWHERLFGNGEEQKQTPEVAIRTWSIGLLQGMGMKMSKAQGRVVDCLKLDEGVAEPQYNRDRQNLIRRVPESRPYVYSRSKVPKV